MNQYIVWLKIYIAMWQINILDILFRKPPLQLTITQRLVIYRFLISVGILQS